jgi:hypothetical protein
MVTPAAMGLITSLQLHAYACEFSGHANDMELLPVLQGTFKVLGTVPTKCDLCAS